MTEYTYISEGDNGVGASKNGSGHSYPLEKVPPSKDTDLIERAVERIIEEHSETLEKLGNE
jgi:hypothetical protein